ncbi:hypothetical protein M5K25_005269 [Dendrobium thyrsiflorum]|uniref:RRM domain-containing protein n=1 Tax=Dendrobium thyrsiflorum TaxID=117978 RepID=A0ABD0VH11_DENTH
MSAAPALKLFSMADSCLATLPVHFASNNLFHRRSKSICRLSISCSYSSLSALPLLLFLRKDKKPSVVPLVARTSGWVGEESSDRNSGERLEPPDAELSEGDFMPEGDNTVDEGFVEGDGEGSYPDLLEEAKLFVGNLPYDVDSEKLAHLFEGAGIVEVAEVIYNRDTDQSRGFGFVTMSTVEEAEKAVELYHRYDCNGRLLTVNKAAPRGSRPERSPREFEPSLRVYVGNLPWQVDDTRLEQLFSEHGKVLSARVVYDRESGRSRGFGFVTMESKSELDDAIAALDGQILDGRTIRVNVAEERPRRGSF